MHYKIVHPVNFRYLRSDKSTASTAIIATVAAHISAYMPLIEQPFAGEFQIHEGPASHTWKTVFVDINFNLSFLKHHKNTNSHNKRKVRITIVLQTSAVQKHGRILLQACHHEQY